MQEPSVDYYNGSRQANGDSTVASWTEHHIHVSPGSIERMVGWLVMWKCLVACLFFDESQQPTWPQAKQSRRCTQRSPVFRHSSQPFGVFGFRWNCSVVTVFRCSQAMARS